MEVSTQDGFSFELVGWRRRGGRSMKAFGSQAQALAFLRGASASTRSMRQLRKLLGEELGQVDTSTWSDEQVLEWVSWELSTGRLGVLETERGRLPGGDGPTPSDGPTPEDPPTPQPKGDEDEEVKKASVKVELADPGLVDVDRDSKGQKLGLEIKTLNDETSKLGKFDGKLTLSAVSGGDRIKILDGKKELKLPHTIEGGALRMTTRLQIVGVKASGKLDDVELEAKIEKAGKVDVGKTGSEKVKLTVVDLRAENGKDDPPHVVPVKNDHTDKPKAYRVKIKAVPDLKGTWKWTTKSATLTIEDDTKQTATIVAKDKPSSKAKAEVITLEAARSGKKPIKLKHMIGGVQVIFSEDLGYDGGYDKYEKITGVDNDNNKTNEEPGPEYDFVAVERGKDATVQVAIKGAAKEDVFFTSDSSSTAKPKSEHASALSGDFFITGGNKKKATTVISARVGSKKGPVVAKLGVCVYKKTTLKAEFFRVKDSKSPSTSLSLGSITGAKIKTGAVGYYSQVIAELDITGGTAEKDVPYDSHATKSIKNGALDLEPGKTSAEEKIIMKACKSSRARAIYIKKLRWSYYFAADAKAGDTTIKLRKYGNTYLGYIGTDSYKIEDTAGNSETITVKSVNKKTGVVTLASGLTNAYKRKDKPVLIWPLGGLSGNPVWVSDKSSEADLINYTVHELGHQIGGWNDVCETDNFMHGGSAMGSRLRHRPIKKYYKPSKTERQWNKLKR